MNVLPSEEGVCNGRSFGSPIIALRGKNAPSEKAAEMVVTRPFCVLKRNTFREGAVAGCERLLLCISAVQLTWESFSA